ncbi:monovalent cation/H+ antiporter subunit A [Halomonas icarae]|uniref:Monovalent cation/H+ antiporter subunit A n=1 Tax=Halomonas icarae TaxID=2691040 RepID=A0A7X4VYX9_9GAMM|nr:monovalent cation/H+ antiporter subunit A [Halomonas icarae]MDR5902173.1 monovalent cation/H+ antiporter subunit A [Halomonas icarae]NAW11983.1 monovalent cation/H+ antiporter subunit A [Halomonas icarae]
MPLVLIILLPLTGACLPALLQGRSSRLLASVSALPALFCLLLLLSWLPHVMQDGAAVVQRLSWLPSLGLDASFRLDGLGLLFALLITGVGCLILLYARYYFEGSEATARFFTLLLLFMAAMLGIVLSENLLFMLVFWELTSLTSFLLIGYHTDDHAARLGARMSLVITGGGGLALLAGIMLLGQAAGSYELSIILEAGEHIRASEHYGLMLNLILLGAFTKSAQFPFHLWLPHAMTAPTPVSAYLHSATMVKAGLFLLARLHPALADTTLWFYLVTLTGMLTLMVGAFVAMFMHDMKGLLAYSTVSHLGLIMLLLGLGTPMALAAALFHLVCHALFKAPLFMMAGYVDHATGSRDMRHINGMWRFMPALMVLSGVASAAMAGLPLMSGYLSKKMLFNESLLVVIPEWATVVIPAWVALAALFSVAYSIRIFHNVFFNGRPIDLPIWPPAPPRLAALSPIMLPVLATLLVGLAPQPIYMALVHPAFAASRQIAVAPYDFTALDGRLPMLMSLFALAGGALFYHWRTPLFRLHCRLPMVDAKEIFDWLMRRATALAQQRVFQLENGSLQRYLAFILATLVVLVGLQLRDVPRWDGGVALAPLDPLTLLAAILLCLTSLGVVVYHHHRLPALLLLGVTGLFVTVTFARFSAPDLALTQLMVEVMAVVIMMLALSFLPQTSPRGSTRLRMGRDLTIAGLMGLGVAAFSFAILTRPQQTISDFFLANSVPGGGGSNVVNVILVDFRGFDTLGEITVLGIAAVAVFAFTRDLHLKARVVDTNPTHWVAEPYPIMLGAVARLVLPVALLVSAYIFLRGHNQPGGGFIAGLITAVALTLQYMAGGLVWAQARMPTAFRPMIGAGVLIASFTGLGSWLFGFPFLTSAHGHLHLPLIGEFELATAMLFDLGVYATVVGATLLILANLGKLMTVAGPGKEIG